MKIIISLIALFALAGLGYWQLLYPPVVLKRQTEEALETFAKAVATKDREQVKAAFYEFFAEGTKIRLEVRIASLNPNDQRVQVQDFDKTSWISFVDNVLYSLTDYGFTPELKTFDLSSNGTIAAVVFDSKSWAVGRSYYGGLGLNMNYNADTTCAGKVTFTSTSIGKPQMNEAVCKMTLRMAPTSEEMNKFKDPEQLRKLLN